MSERRRVQLEPAWLLHRYPYRESSLILEVLTRDWGRVGLVAKGARGARRGDVPLAPFTPLLVSFRHGKELATLAGAERRGPAHGFTGTAFFAACYLNELLLRLLPRDDPAADVFALYEATLPQLGARPAPAVRRFEGRLIRLLGFMPPLTRDAKGAAVDAAASYRYDPERGLVPARDGYSGTLLGAIAAERYEDMLALGAAAKLFRAIIDTHLGGRPLRTLEVARAAWNQPGAMT